MSYVTDTRFLIGLAVGFLLAALLHSRGIMPVKKPSGGAAA